MTITFRGGRLPNDPAKPRLRLSRFLTANRYTPPPAADWDRKVSAFGMLANDRLGDCHWAASYHALQTWTANAGIEIHPTDGEAIQAYSEATGYRSDDPGSDQGTVMQEGLNYWRKVGLPVGVVRHKILAFAEVDHRNPVEMEAAVALFGEVLLGIDFPTAAMQAFDAGEPWDVWEDDGGIEGGHAICAARYDAPAKRWYVITWGREQEVTQAFLDAYLEEAWVAVAPEWITANGTAPSGLDLIGLAAAFTQITGEPAVWGGTPPEPPPHPDALVAAARTLAADQGVLGWLRVKHSGTPKHVAKLIQALVDAA